MFSCSLPKLIPRSVAIIRNVKMMMKFDFLYVMTYAIRVQDVIGRIFFNDITSLGKWMKSILLIAINLTYLR